MKPLKDLSDDEIDALLLLLFGEAKVTEHLGVDTRASTEGTSDADLRRIRSRNHPDKWPNVDLQAYRDATAEISRRRRERKQSRST